MGPTLMAGQRVTPAMRAALAAFDVLNSRGGFDHWWDGIDEDIQQEIIEEMASAIEPFAAEESASG